MMPRYWFDVYRVKTKQSHSCYGEYDVEKLRIVVWDTTTGREIMDVSNENGRYDYLSNEELREMAVNRVRQLTDAIRTD